MNKSGFFIFAVLIVLFFFTEVEGQKKNKQGKFDKFQRKRKDDCTNRVCGHIPKDLNDNCVNQCFTVTCFDKFYKESPLEDGEYDAKRQRSYNDCAREEFSLCMKNITHEACPQHIADYLLVHDPKYRENKENF